MRGILAFYPKVKVVERQAHLTQITPTILNFFGLRVPEYCHGQSLLPKSELEENILEIEV